MAYEVRPWKEEGCSLTLYTELLSRREPHSSEVNETFGEGGGLNANYQTVEAIAKATNILGLADLRYGEDFVFKTADLDKISFDFRDRHTKLRAKRALSEHK